MDRKMGHSLSFYGLHYYLLFLSVSLQFDVGGTHSQHDFEEANPFRADNFLQTGFISWGGLIVDFMRSIIVIKTATKFQL